MAKKPRKIKTAKGLRLKSKRIGIHVLLQKKLSKGGGLLSFVSLLWMVANGQVIDSCISPMAY